MKSHFISRIYSFVLIVISFASLAILKKSDSFMIPYVLVLLCGVVASLFRTDNIFLLKESNERKRFIEILCSVLFGLIVVSANYDILFYSDSIVFLNCIRGLILFICFFCAANQILFFFETKVDELCWREKKKKSKFRQIYVLLICVYLLFFSNFFIFTNCEFPGNLTEDSFNQLSQIVTGTYSNHHPVAHTLLIKIAIMVGSVFTDDFASQIATYSVIQIVFMAFCFGFTVFTCYEIGMPYKYLVLLILNYLLMPYHIDYSYTIWKDVIFGGCCLLFCVAAFRLFNKLQYRLLNYILLIISFCGIGLMRSNGLFVALLTLGLFLVLFRNKYKTIIFLMISGVLFCFGSKYLVTSYLNIYQPDTIEYLSIPSQQLARVITMNNDLTDSEAGLLGEIIEIDKISDCYMEYLSDPIKDLVREKGNQELLEKNKARFLWLYIKVGLRHPVLYTQGWIEQTKGFWNAGYEDKIWPNMIVENDYYMRKICDSEYLDQMLDRYFELFKTNFFLQAFISIGLYVWILLLMFYVSWIRGDKVGVWLLFPMFAVIFSLLISTPVATEFRYAYSVFCSLPFGMCIVFRPKQEDKL